MGCQACIQCVHRLGTLFRRVKQNQVQHFGGARYRSQLDPKYRHVLAAVDACDGWLELSVCSGSSRFELLMNHVQELRRPGGWLIGTVFLRSHCANEHRDREKKDECSEAGFRFHVRPPTWTILYEGAGRNGR